MPKKSMNDPGMRFTSGRRHWRFCVPLRDLTEPLADAGFVIERLCGPKPGEELKLRDPKGYDRLCRLPAFIFVRAKKSQAPA
jgi:hypothetical protein